MEYTIEVEDDNEIYSIPCDLETNNEIDSYTLVAQDQRLQGFVDMWFEQIIFNKGRFGTRSVQHEKVLTQFNAIIKEHHYAMTEGKTCH